MKYLFIVLIIMTTVSVSAQQKPYYYQIPDTPAVYSANTVAARLVDGLGFRYYWATEGLTDRDLAFRPSAEARSSFETIEHIYSLTKNLLNSVSKKPNIISDQQEKMSFIELREKTLENIRNASEILKQPDANLEDFDMIFERGNTKRAYPFWNLINGPISDALWHIGQVVTFRRSSGNPLPEGVNVLTGTKSE